MGDVQLTEVLFAATGFLNDLNQAGPELLDGGDVVGEHAHLSRFGGNVDLNAACRPWVRMTSSLIAYNLSLHIFRLVDGRVRKSQGQLDFVRGYIGVGPRLDAWPEGG